MTEYLYLYSGISDHSLGCLENSEFYFTSPANFNDPFDCKNLFTFDGSDDNDWRLFFDLQIAHQNPQLTEQERKQRLEELVKSEIWKNPDARKEQFRRWANILEEESNKLGIVCLTKDQKDILMWAHYADNHRGFCLQFSKNVIESEFYCSEVNYSPTYPSFSEFVEELIQSGGKNIYKTFLLTKSQHWEYEEEYRLILDPSSRPDSPGKREYKYSENALVGIIWGCQILERNQKMIEFILSKRKTSINFFKARKSSNEYAIGIDPA